MKEVFCDAVGEGCLWVGADDEEKEEDDPNEAADVGEEIVQLIEAASVDDSSFGLLKVELSVEIIGKRFISQD